jgi:uncharacterized membrane protein YsdA (DUF1294 family)
VLENLLWILLGLNLLAFLAIGADKLLAVRRCRRISERRFLWAAALGAGVGILLGAAAFRHKTIKQPFRRWLWLWTVVGLFWVGAWVRIARG